MYNEQLIAGRYDRKGNDVSDVLRGLIRGLREISNIKEALDKHIEIEKIIQENENKLKGAGGKQ